MNRVSGRRPALFPSSSFHAEVKSKFERAVALHRQGELSDAEKSCRSLLQIAPNNFEALHLLGLLMHAQGRSLDALDAIREALQKRPNDAATILNYGGILGQLGRFEEALASFRQVIEIQLDCAKAFYNQGSVLNSLNRFNEALSSFDKAIELEPDYAEAFNNRGMSLAQLGHFDDALVSYDKAVTLSPNFAEAFNNRGISFAELGRFEDALASYDRAITVSPDFAEAFNNRGNAFHALKRYEEALTSYSKAIVLKPTYAVAFNNRGNTLKELKRLTEALASVDKSVVLKPSGPEAFNNRGNILKELHRFEEALASYDQAIAIKADYSEAFNNRGNVLKELNRYDDALKSYETAVAFKPDNSEALNNHAIALTELGRLPEARQSAEQAIRLAPRKPFYYHTLGNIYPYIAGDSRISAMEGLLRDAASLSREDRIYLHFALAKAYEELGQPNTAFKQLLQGNELKRGQIAYDETKTLGSMNQIRATLTSDFFRTRPPTGNRSSVPVFIIGMPRSGSTLVEQILASHPRAFGGGELEHFPRALENMQLKWQRSGTAPMLVSDITNDAFRELGACYLAKIERLSPGAARITDKMTGNFNFAGLIHLSLPNALIIHTIRNPVDTCISCFSKLFNDGTLNYTYDLAELGRYYKHYQALMAHWHAVLPRGRILDVQYEELVANLEPQARRIVAYCGLDWDSRCLGFHQTTRAVRTISATQVRQPIYQTAVGRWRRYEEFLSPLLVELNSHSAMQ